MTAKVAHIMPDPSAAAPGSMTEERLSASVEALALEQATWPTMRDSQADGWHVIEQLNRMATALRWRERVISTIRAKAKAEYQDMMISAVLAQTDVAWWLNQAADERTIASAAQDAAEPDASAAQQATPTPGASTTSSADIATCTRCGTTGRKGDHPFSTVVPSGPTGLCDDCAA